MDNYKKVEIDILIEGQIQKKLKVTTENLTEDAQHNVTIEEAKAYANYAASKKAEKGETYRIEKIETNGKPV